MSEWKTYKYTDIATIVGGGTPKTTEVAYWNGKIPWISIKDLVGTIKYVYSTEKYITELGLTKSSAKLLHEGDIVISARGTIGEIAILSCPMSFNQSCFGICANENIVDGTFLYYLTKTKINALKAVSYGSVFDTITSSTFENLEISLPPLPEQKRIAGILSALDDKIELNRRINANLEAQAMALYKHWFVDGQQEDWEYMMLGDIASVMAGGDRPTICSKTETEETRVPIYSNGIDNEGLYGYTNVAIVNEPSVTISARGTIGYVCLRQNPYTPIVRLISAIPKREYVSAVYLYLWAKNMNIMGTGTTQQQLTVPDFKRQKVLIPDSATMQLFNDAVEPVFELIDAYKQENNAIADTRDTLLPKLMNNTLKRYQHENVL